MSEYGPFGHGYYDGPAMCPGYGPFEDECENDEDDPYSALCKRCEKLRRAARERQRRARRKYAAAAEAVIEKARAVYGPSQDDEDAPLAHVWVPLALYDALRAAIAALDALGGGQK